MTKRTSLIRYLPVYGCYATGVIYLGIGVIAILSFLKIKKGGADESSLLAWLNDSLMGKFVFWFILLGTLCYIVWRIYETITDPYGYGKDASGIAKRAGITISVIPDVLIALAAFQILTGTAHIRVDGRPIHQRQLASNILEQPWGQEIMIAIGAAVVVTALIQLFYGLSKGYKERVDMAHFNAALKKAVRILAWAGYTARGIILGVIGFFFMKAGIEESAELVVNTDKSFDFIGDEAGPAYFILIAIGTICYGLFMFAHGAAYDADKD